MHTTDLEVKAEMAERHGFSPEQFEHLSNLLGRSPNALELSVFANIWSSPPPSDFAQKWIKTLPLSGQPLLKNPSFGGSKLIDLGNGQACAMKLESYIRPVTEGADSSPWLERPIEFVSMGAYPIGYYRASLMNPTETDEYDKVGKALALGKDNIRFPFLGESCFVYESLKQNRIVNNVSLGIVEHAVWQAGDEELIGTQIYLFEYGGDDSNESGPFDSDSDISSHKTNFDELIIEMVKEGKIQWVDDLKHRSIAFALANWSMHSGKGTTVNLNQLTEVDEEHLLADLLTSKMPQKLLLIGQLGDEQQEAEFFEKLNANYWNLGQVTETGKLEYYYREAKVADLPSNAMSLRLNTETIFDKESSKPDYLKKVKRFNLNKFKVPKSTLEAAQKMYSSPSLNLNEFGLEQEFEWGVLIENGPSDAVKIHNERSGSLLLVSTECNMHYLSADPYQGASIALATAIRKIICAGGIPLANFNFLYLGNLESSVSRFQFTNIIKGLGDACRKFGIPVAGCEETIFSSDTSIDATNLLKQAPMIGILGNFQDEAHETTFDFKNEGDLIYMIGNSYNDLGSSVFIRNVHGVQSSPCPRFDLHEEFEVQSHVRNLICKKIVVSAHGVNQGGLFACLMESAKVRSLGFQIETVETFRKDCFLFGESQSRVVISISAKDEDELQNYLVTNNVSFTKLGEVIGKHAMINDENFGSINDWNTIFDNNFNEILEQ